jgi:hypothetical protein
MELYTYLQQYVQCNIRKTGWEMGNRQREAKHNAKRKAGAASVYLSPTQRCGGVTL